MRVKINLHGNPIPEQHGEWVDLSTAEDIELHAGDFKIISLGISMELPEDFYAELMPRSSTFKKWGILQTNSVGVIENDYCGDNDIWGFPAYATRDVIIPKNTRIAQFCIKRKEEPIHFVVVDSLNNANRGGFGSTGV